VNAEGAFEILSEKVFPIKEAFTSKSVLPVILESLNRFKAATELPDGTAPS
jgi:hypothetical protein